MPRVKWDLKHEKLLMDAYFAARCDESLRTEKGIRSKAWLGIVDGLRAAGFEVDREQCKTKYSRIMVEHAALKDVLAQSGAEWDNATDKPILSDASWRELAETKSRMASLYRRFRADGFPHRHVCSLIVGDTPTSEAEEQHYKRSVPVPSFLAPSEDEERDSEIAQGLTQTPDASDTEDVGVQSTRKRGIETLGGVGSKRNKVANQELTFRREQFVRRLLFDEKQHADRMAIEREKITARAEAEQRNRELILQCVSLVCETFRSNRNE